jgi:hypothetical protein
MNRNELNELLKADFSKYIVICEEQICQFNDQLAKEELGEELYESRYLVGSFAELPRRLWKLDDLDPDEIRCDPLDYIFVKCVEYMVERLSSGFRNSLNHHDDDELTKVLKELKQLYQQLSVLYLN